MRRCGATRVNLNWKHGNLCVISEVRSDFGGFGPTGDEEEDEIVFILSVCVQVCIAQRLNKSGSMPH